MRLLILLFFLITIQISKAQKSTNELKFPEVGWTIFIPSDAKFLNEAQFDTLKKKGEDAINNAYGVDESLKGLNPLFTISDKQYNIFGSSINLYDSTLFNSWQESYQASKTMVIDILNQQGSQIKIADTISSSEKIDGISFQIFYIKTVYPVQNLTMHSYWYYRKQGIYDFSINISFTDEAIGKKYLDILKSSRFEK